MPDKFDLPEKIPASKVTLIKRSHLHDEEMFQAINLSREFLRRYLFWVDGQKSIEDVASATDMFGNLWLEKENFAYAIIDNVSGKLLGCIDLHEISYTNRIANIGYWLSQNKTGRGFMADALRAIEQEAFSQGFNRLEIRCDAENRPSANVALRGGYEFESTRKQAICAYGEFRDEEVYIKLRYA